MHSRFWLAAACAFKSVVLSSVSFSGPVAWPTALKRPRARPCCRSTPRRHALPDRAGPRPGCSRSLSGWPSPLTRSTGSSRRTGLVLATVSTLAVWGGVLVSRSASRPDCARPRWQGLKRHGWRLALKGSPSGGAMTARLEGCGGARVRRPGLCGKRGFRRHGP